MPQRSRPLLIILPLAVLALAAALTGCGGDDDDGATSTPAPASGAVGVGDLARSVVQIFALDADDESVWTGSGTIISPDGHILTNAHVVDDRSGEYATLGVGLTAATDEPPVIEYEAEISAVDYALDLAVIQILGVPNEEFPYIAVSDSDEVEIGDEIEILGYPGIGGETITFTRGVISGFTGERLVGSRAWIKTDATIAGGNSGGLAVDAQGRLIGVPTIVGSGSDSATTDCRLIQDTNDDGTIDESDDCVTVGGFINGVRPVNLARDLIDAALAGDKYVSPYYEDESFDEPPTGGGFDTSEINIDRVVFSPDVTESDLPTEEVLLFPSAPQSVCAFWDYSGMENGMTWEAVWYIDGEISEDGSILDDVWAGDDMGTWWVCIVDEAGLADGLYEVVISVEGESQGSEAVFVGGNRRLVDFVIENGSGVEICGVWMSPVGAQNWGIEDLGAETTLPPGEAVTLTPATGLYDILVYDCEGETLDEQRDIEVLDDAVYTVTR
jgi:S1-C subfamily serine protease